MSNNFVPKNPPRVRVNPERHGLIKRYAIIEQLTIPQAMDEIIEYFFKHKYNGDSEPNGELSDLKDRLSRLEKQFASIL